MAPKNDPPPLSTGPGAAAILATGVGALALGVLAFAGDAVRSFGRAMIFWPPSGPLSGVTTVAIVVWLGVWAILARRWARRDVNLVPINIAAFLMLAAGLLLTFPPVMDFLQGK